MMMNKRRMAGAIDHAVTTEVGKQSHPQQQDGNTMSSERRFYPGQMVRTTIDVDSCDGGITPNDIVFVNRQYPTSNGDKVDLARERHGSETSEVVSNGVAVEKIAVTDTD